MKYFFTTITSRFLISAATLSAAGFAPLPDDFTFASVKPLPLVTTATAYQPPTLQDNATWTERAAALAALDAALAANPAALNSAALPRFFTDYADACERAGDAAQAAYARARLLVCPSLGTNELYRARHILVRSLASGSDGQHARPALAVSLAREIAADVSLQPERRYDPLVEVCVAVSRSAPELSAKIQERLLLAADLPEILRVKTADSLASKYSGLAMKQRPEDWERVVLDIATNAALSAETRASHLVTLITTVRPALFPKGHDDDREARNQLVRDFLASEKSLTEQQRITLHTALMNNLSQGGAASQDTAAVEAAAIFANTNATFAQRDGAARVIANRASARGDYAEADRVFLASFALPAQSYESRGVTVRDYINSHIRRDNLDAALLACTSLTNVLNSPDKARLAGVAVSERSRVLSEFMMFEAAMTNSLDAGDKVAAAKLADSWDYPLALRLYKEILADEKLSRDARVNAYSALFYRDKALTDRYWPFFLGDTALATNRAIQILTDKLVQQPGCYSPSASGYPFVGDDDGTIFTYERLRTACAAAGLPVAMKPSQFAAYAYANQGDLDSALAAVRLYLDGTTTNTPAADVYQMRLFRDVLPLAGNNVDKLATAIARIERAHLAAAGGMSAGLDPEVRTTRMKALGALLNYARRDDTLRALVKYNESFFAEAPRRTFKVKFFDTPLAGMADFLTNLGKIEMQLLDRPFGGQTDMLYTVVGLGDNSTVVAETAKNAAAKAAASKKEPTKLRIAADDTGIHFLFEIKTGDARKIESGIVNGGNFESYIAPGENQPYYCLMHDVSPNAFLQVYDTTYDTTGYRRINSDTPASRLLTSSQLKCTDDTVFVYQWLSWENFADHIPENGDEYEFDTVFWSPGNPTWNGCKDLHARSSWGRLSFDLPGNARAKILRRIIFRAANAYQREKKCENRFEGAIEKWSDPVLGDAEFYEARVAPYVEKLDKHLDLLKVDMSDADVIKVAEEALPCWRDIVFTLQRMHRDWIEEKLAE